MAGLDRDFLSMLESVVVWEHFIGEDLFGNDVYDPPVNVAANISNVTGEYGTEDGQNQQDAQRVLRGDLFLNYVGVMVKDRLSFGGHVMYAQSVTTGHDERGEPLYHEVSAATVKRG